MISGARGSGCAASDLVAPTLPGELDRAAEYGLRLGADALGVQLVGVVRQHEPPDSGASSDLPRVGGGQVPGGFVGILVVAQRLPEPGGLDQQQIRAACELDELLVWPAVGAEHETTLLAPHAQLERIGRHVVGDRLEAHPHLVELQERMGKRLTVVGVACEAEGPEVSAAKVGETVKRMSVNYPVLLSRNDGSCPLQEALHVSAFPTMVLVDRQGRVLWRDQGATPATLARLDRMLATTPVPDVTRR